MLNELIRELKQKDVHLYLQDGRLRCKALPSILTPELKSVLQNYKAELTSYLTEAQQQHSEQFSLIRTILFDGYYPLSFAQYRLWFLNQFESDSTFYNMAGAIQLIGELDVVVLKRSLNEIIRRHEVLRTTFDVHDGQPAQVIVPVLELDITIVDLSPLSEDQRKNEVDRYLVEEACRSFNLATGPLVRTTLLSLGVSATSGHTEHILLFSMHHIISDGWSTGILVREFVALYEAFRAGQSSPLPELTIQYADYAAWQREWLQGDRLAHQLDYWRQQLAGAPAVLELPTDRPRPAVQSYRGAEYRFTIPKNITAQLKVLSRQEETTLFMTLLTAFNILLSRYSNQHDVCIGTPVANRNRIEIEGLIGFFVNTLVLRTDLSGNPIFKQLLAHVKKVCLDAQTHQDLPFEKLVEELAPVRDMSRNPLFQVMFVLQNVPETQLAIDGLQIIPVEMDTDSAKFDLHLEITERQESLEALFNYNTDLFDESTIVRIAGHFRQLLEGIVSSPDKRLADLSLLTDVERKQLLDWNATEVTYPQNYCLHQLFEAQVEKNPTAIAVIFEDQQLTYEQVNARANQLAHYLRAQGVGPEVLVGICIERSLEMVIGILGILKAEGAYVPIDPKAPRKRIADVLNNTRPVLLLTQEKLEEQLPSAIQRLNLDSEWSQIAEERTDLVISTVTPDNLAYVLHTSGSTGKPKGVAVTHRNVVNSTQARLDYYRQPIDSFLLLSSITFDSSIAGLFGTLSQGGCLVFPQDDALLDVSYLTRLITDHKVSHLLAVPSLYKAILRQLATDHRDTSLKAVLVAGEACYPDLVGLHYQTLPQVELFNEYGPTEATVWCSVYQVQPEAIQHTISIGRPIANTQIYLLDAYLNPVPIGVTGELYIGSVGITRGYLNNPGLTAERFIPNPFSQQSGERLYRTGDLARYRTNGNIEYLGRTDHQVKIRGFRIELGEIEAALLQLEQVKEAVALVRDDNPENPQLVAYLVGDTQASDIEVIRTQLKTRLPDYMLPSAFVFLDSLPLTTNGKLDRKALPAPDISTQSTHEYIAPRNLTEEKLAEIWAEVLGVEKVGIHDNFFELGGHSLLVMKMVHRINYTFESKLELRTFFNYATVAAMAQLIDQGSETSFEDIAALVDLNKEARLDSEIYPVGNSESITKEPKAIFLTGSTGFLGSFLLSELIQQTSADIYCLVRANSETAAFDKLKHNLQKYGIYNEACTNRIIPVCGDLTQPSLGLSTEQFFYLAKVVDAIYHNGASVDFIQPYSALKDANVQGTQEVLRLACARKTVPVHYVSTLSVFSEVLPDGHPGFSEDDPLDANAKLSNGYGQSKWVAERLVNICAKRGLPITIYRSATITGHSQTGTWNTDDYLCRLIRGCIVLGRAPADTQATFNIVPVDYASKAIITLSRNPSAIGNAFHLSNTVDVNSLDIVRWINELGYLVKLEPYPEWRQNMLTVVSRTIDHPLYPLLPIFHPAIGETNGPFDDRVRYRNDKTNAVLANCGIQCAAPDRKLFNVYLHYFQKNNLLKFYEV